MTEPLADPHTTSTPQTSSTGCAPWLLGCVLGCGALVFLGAVALAVAGWWFVRPGEQHPTTAAVGPETLGAFRVADLGEDEGAREALTAIVRETSRLSPPPADAERPFWIQSDDPEALAELFGRMLPREGTVAFEPVPGGGEPTPVLVLNLRGLTRPLRMILEGDGQRSEVYRGVTLTTEEGGEGVFAMVDGTLVAAERPEAVRAVIDRILDDDTAPLATSFEVLDPPAPDALLSGGTSFEAGALADSLRREEEERGEPPPIDPTTLEGVTRFELVVDDLDAEAVRLRVGLGAVSEDAAATAARAMESLIRQEMAPASARVRTRTAGSTAVLEVEVTEWVGPFAEWLARSDEDEDPSYEPGTLERLPGQ